MSAVIFVLFSIYGVISSYLPLIIRALGFSATATGFLMAVFEFAGLIIPLVLSPLVEKTGRYGFFLLIFALLMAVVPFPLVSNTNFLITALLLAVFSVGYKGSVPVSDTLTNIMLGDRTERYGTVRVMGSIGFVVTNLAMQFFFNLEEQGTKVLAWWIIVPSVVYAATILLAPGALKSYPSVPAPKDKTEKPDKNILKEFPPVYWAGIALIFMGFFAFVPVQKFFSMYVTEELHSNTTSLMWAISATSEIPFMFFSYKFIKKYGSLKLLIICTIAVGIREIVYVACPNVAGAAIGQLFNSFTYGLFHPAAVFFCTEYAPQNRKVLSMAFYSIMATGVSSIIGNAVCGVIIDSLGYKPLFLIFAAIAFATAALFTFILRAHIFPRSKD
ncbi:MAG: MFS transporter [Treponemataceae bacterium]|nr:MFS transporter [Treponemataceae bacterium]